MRLIDADALIDDIKNNLWDWETVDGITATTVLKQTISDIENAPTIEERKKGKWEAFMAYGKTVRHRCSECLAVAARDDFGKEYLSDYCSVCGSDMRGTPL